MTAVKKPAPAAKKLAPVNLDFKTIFTGLEQGIGLGFTISIPLAVGTAGGVILDKRLEKAPLFLLLGLFFGLSSATYAIVKFLKQSIKEEK